MASTGAPQQTHRQSSSGGGGTGFLFGNIDERGRLDEDYLDDDAKDHLDNVAPTVAERDPSLREITAAVPKQNRSKPGGADSDSEGSSRGDFAPTEHAETAADYYDEHEIMEDLDEPERARLAAMAISAAVGKPTQGIPADDENYDDDDEEGAGEEVSKSKANSGLAPPSLGAAINAGTAVVGMKLQKDSSVIPGPPPQPAGPRAMDVIKARTERPTVGPGLREGVASEEAVQRQLMEAARKGAIFLECSGHEIAKDPLPDEEPLRFSEVLTKQPKVRIVPKRKRYGVSASKDANEASGEAQFPMDDAVKLETPLPLSGIDPVELFLKLDRVHKRKQFERANLAYGQAHVESAGRGPDQGTVGKPDTRDSNGEEYAEFAAPLMCDIKRRSRCVREDDEARHAIIQQVAWEKEICWADGDESGADYSDEENRESGSMNKAPKAAVSDSEDDDEMEWEEGGAVQARSDNPAENATSEALTSAGADAQGDKQKDAKLGAGTEALERVAEGPSVIPPDTNGGGQGTDESRALGALEELDVRSPGPMNADRKIVPQDPQDPVIRTILAPNSDLEEGLWVRDVDWDSDGERQTSPLTPTSDGSELTGVMDSLSGRTDRLILDMNDENMQLEPADSPADGRAADKRAHALRQGVRFSRELQGAGLVEADELSAIPGNLVSLRPVDPFNISNDKYYVKRSNGSMLKIDRRAILRGLRNAPPAINAQTTIPNPSDDYLTRFHRPFLTLESYPGPDEELVPFRRKHPKGGSSQIAGQIPKKPSELLASSKDAFRICLFEYAIEYEPCLLPIPGTAFRVVTYDRKDSAQAAAQARKDATGTPDADTVFMAPEEVPPLHAGDLKQNDKPLLVLESHLFSAPCARTEPGACDFLVTRRRGKMYVREIDSVVSVGVTEPKVEVMAPNSERFKKFAKDRVLLWLLREFLKNQRKKDGSQKKKEDSTSSIDREQLFAEFSRRRTFPETSLIKMLKELSRYQNGKYVLMEEPPKGFAAMDAELLRTVNPEETSAFESMEAGWHRLINLGIQILTVPQSNIRSAAEKTGLRAGLAVGKFIWNRLQHTPWYRSQVMILVQRQQRKELMQALASARIANDLREGGAVMEARVASLSAVEAANVLANQYRVQARKIPQDLDARREMVREYAIKKSKGTERLDYQEIIAGIISKNRTAGGSRTAPGAGATAVVASGDVLTIPLEQQRLALEEGIVGGLPKEEEEGLLLREIADAERYAVGANERNVCSTLARPSSSVPSNVNADSDGGLKKQLKSKRVDNVLGTASAKGAKRSGDGHGQEKQSTPGKEGNDEAGREKAVVASSHGDNIPKKKKIKQKLKITRKVVGPDGTKTDVVEYITDPAEIERMLAKSRAKAKKSSGGSQETSQPGVAGQKEAGGSASGGGGPLKIQINLRKLSQGRAGARSKPPPSSSERKRSAGESKKPVPQKVEPAVPLPGPITISPSDRRDSGLKGQVGKLKINPKLARQAQEELLAKRKRSQYGDDLEYSSRKAAKKNSTSRRKRNGTVLLNGILESIEKIIRDTEGYIERLEPEMIIARVRPGESAPPGAVPSNLARPSSSYLDFTKAVDTKSAPTYKDIVKKQMYLDVIKYKCKHMEYKSSRQFLADMKLLLDNARAFNSTPDVKWVVRHAELLYEVATEQIELRADEISVAEDQVRNEQAGALSSSAADPKPPKTASKRHRDASSKPHHSTSRPEEGDSVKNLKPVDHETLAESAGADDGVEPRTSARIPSASPSPPFLGQSLAYGLLASPDLNDDIGGGGDDAELDLPDMDL